MPHFLELLQQSDSTISVDDCQQYLTILQEELRDKNRNRTEYNNIRSGLAHVASILKWQSQLAKQSNITQDIRPIDLANKVIAIVGSHHDSGDTALHVEAHEAAEHEASIETHKVEMILINLIINGMQAMRNVPEEKQSITIHIHQLDGSLHFRVSDHGCGITHQDQAELFTLLHPPSRRCRFWSVTRAYSQKVLVPHYD